jgi:DNA-directed RNA polymerase subunit K/omega
MSAGEQMLAAARALQTEAGAPFAVTPQENLPGPVPGAENGTLSC